MRIRFDQGVPVPIRRYLTGQIVEVKLILVGIAWEMANCSMSLNRLGTMPFSRPTAVRIRKGGCAWMVVILSRRGGLFEVLG